MVDTPVQVMKKWHQWAIVVFIVATILSITFIHYLTGLSRLSYHAIYRSLYYLPIAVAAVQYGQKGGMVTALVVCVLFLPRTLFYEAHPGEFFDNVLEMPVFVLVGVMVGWLTDRERQQRQRADALRAYVDSVMQSLPVGVMTMDGNTYQPVPRNPIAVHLLQTTPKPEQLLESLHHMRSDYQLIDLSDVLLGVYSSALQDGQGQMIGRVYVLEDLTEQRALETQVRRMDRLASVGQFASGIAHEIRNPLAILRATSQLLAERLRADESLASYLSVLVSESDRIDRLISELQDYARPRPPAKELLDLAEVLRGARDGVRPYARQYEVHVEVVVESGISLHADSQQIHQLLINLLMNAIQASSSGGIVQLSGAYAHDGWVQVDVADNGCGMSPDVQERACDPFFTTRDNGTGLGLAIVMAMVQQHKGRLHFDSVVGQGTHVSMLFPPPERRGGLWREC